MASVTKSNEKKGKPFLEAAEKQQIVQLFFYFYFLYSWWTAVQVVVVSLAGVETFKLTRGFGTAVWWCAPWSVARLLPASCCLVMRQTTPTTALSFAVDRKGTREGPTRPLWV